MSNGKSRRKGKEGELDVVHKLRERFPDAQRVGLAFITSLVDVEWGEGQNKAQVKNKTLGGSAIANILEEIRKIAPESKGWVIYKAKRGQWIIAQSLEQYLRR